MGVDLVGHVGLVSPGPNNCQESWYWNFSGRGCLNTATPPPPGPAETQEGQPVCRTTTHSGTQCESAALRHTDPSIKPDPCRDARNAFRQSTQAPTAGGCTLICRTHVLTFALLHTPPSLLYTERTWTQGELSVHSCHTIGPDTQTRSPMGTNSHTCPGR